MAQTTTASAPDIEYHFVIQPDAHVCAVCGRHFETHIGPWPFAAGTDRPVCGGTDCTTGDEVQGPEPCTTRFLFAELQPETLRAIEAVQHPIAAERLRLVSLDERLPDEDRSLLQRAAIDLQFCEAGSTRIERTQPRLVLRTCSEAAGEMLLSGCGEIG